MVAVTGANGLLGNFIIRKLIEQNESVLALKRKGSDISMLLDIEDKITWCDADILDPVSLQEVLEKATHVIHTAAIVSFNPRKAKDVMDVNVQGTRNVVNACLGLGIKRLIHISSVAALGRQKNQTSINEKNKWISSPFNSVYAESKYASELEVFRGQEEGLSSVILNPSVILGPGNWHRSSAQLFKYSWQEKPFITDGFLNYVDVRDVASVACQLLHHQIENERFIVSGGNISYEGFFGKTAKQFHTKPPHIKLGKTLVNVLARIESFRTHFTSAEPIITPETARFSGTEFLYENHKIKNLLNIEFQSIDETLQWCCEYYIQRNQFKKIG
ncbi:MAG TPA: NAD-dependent epimerase/dehydratase family protein [Chryseolinea sp.]|nr:NAD-dependent epimerase/dehydratase family protein [Chryseolinea sp.]